MQPPLPLKRMALACLPYGLALKPDVLARYRQDIETLPQHNKLNYISSEVLAHEPYAATIFALKSKFFFDFTHMQLVKAHFFEVECSQSIKEIVPVK